MIPKVVLFLLLKPVFTMILYIQVGRRILQSGRIDKGLCNYEAAIDRFREAAELRSKNMRK
jgi:hypothetical protein